MLSVSLNKTFPSFLSLYFAVVKIMSFICVLLMILLYIVYTVCTGVIIRSLFSLFQSLALLDNDLDVKQEVLKVLQRFSKNSRKLVLPFFQLFSRNCIKCIFVVFDMIFIIQLHPSIYLSFHSSIHPFFHTSCHTSFHLSIE